MNIRLEWKKGGWNRGFYIATFNNPELGPMFCGEGYSQEEAIGNLIRVNREFLDYNISGKDENGEEFRYRMVK